MTQASRALVFIQNARDTGKTANEVEEGLGVTTQQARHYVNALLNQGKIKKRDKKRVGNAGKYVSVYIACDIPSDAHENTKEGAQAFWLEIRDRISTFAKKSARDVEPLAYQHAYHTLEADLRDCIGAFTAKVQRLRVPQVNPVTRNALRDACEFHGISVPKPGAAADLDAAKKSKRTYVREYHPDMAAAKGIVQSDTQRELFQAAVEAYDVIEQYNEFIASGSNVHGQE